MKKSLFLIAFCTLLLSDCTKEQTAATDAQNKVAVSFVATLSDGAVTKASFDGDGAGVYADRCKLQVWWGDKLFLEKTAAVSDLKATFENIVLVKDQTYDFLFWADNTDGSYYVTEDLHDVSLAGTYVGGKDQRDAFSAALVGETVTAAFSRNVCLYRPFAQLNVITTEIPSFRSQITDDALFAAVLPSQAGITVTVPTHFNVKSGEASEPSELAYIAPVYTTPFKMTEGAKNTLSMDYLFAPSAEGNVVEVKFAAKNTSSGMADINHTFSNIPLRRNYRTNIIGTLIGVVGTVNVEIKPIWSDPEYNVN